MAPTYPLKHSKPYNVLANSVQSPQLKSGYSSSSHDGFLLAFSNDVQKVDTDSCIFTKGVQVWDVIHHPSLDYSTPVFTVDTLPHFPVLSLTSSLHGQAFSVDFVMSYLS